MRRIFAIPDIHGCLPPLMEALRLIPVDDPAVTVVFLGDYVDRGPDSAAVLRTVQGLSDRYRDRVVALLGNHEADFLEWLDGDEEDFDWLLADPGLRTVTSFLGPEEAQRTAEQLLRSDGDPQLIAAVNARVQRRIRTAHATTLAWLRRRPLVHETDQQIFVHAGIDEEAGDDWRLATADEVFTHKYPPGFGAFEKMIVAGHVATAELNPDRSHSPFIDDGHIYLDGGVEHTGVLNILEYDTSGDQYRFFTAGG